MEPLFYLAIYTAFFAVKVFAFFLLGDDNE
jgi:hypothetical protein